MTPEALVSSSFTSYPPEAKQLASTHLPLLQQLPLAFLPLLLREVIAYDWKFPAERKELDDQFTYLRTMSPEQLRHAMASFASLQVSPKLEELDWVNAPGQFSEQLSAHLWASHQIDTFRAASVEYVTRMNAAAPQEALPTHRLAIVLIGLGVKRNDYPLFRKLRPYGVYYPNVDPENGRGAVLKAVADRSAAFPIPF